MKIVCGLRGRCGVLFAVALCAFAVCRSVSAQTAGIDEPKGEAPALISAASSGTAPDAPASSPASAPDPQSGSGYQVTGCDVSRLKVCVKDFLGDQAGIWTSPFRLHLQDALWLLPLAGATAVSFHYDVRTLQSVSTSSNRIRISSDLSDAGTYGAVGVAGAAYIFGKVTHNEVVRQTGVLSLEAMADATVVTEVLKFATNRERPYTATGQGRFWPDGQAIYTTNGSFPSEHATIIWAFSHVIADETPDHRWLHLALYAAATGVSVARVTSRNHFPSDVVVGSAIGYLVGGYVYRRNSDSYDAAQARTPFTVAPAFDVATGSYGIGVTLDPDVLGPGNLKRLWSRAFTQNR